MRRAVRPRLATGNEPRMQMNSRATSIPQQQGGGWFRRLKKRQPITARRVDEMEVRLPLEESLCPHRSSSSAFSTGVSSSTPCCILPLSRHFHPRSASFYFYFHPLCTVLPPLPYRIADRVVSVALLATAYILPRGPSAYLCCTWPATPVSIAKKFTFAKKRAREKSMLAAHWPRGRWIAAALALVASRAWLKDELSLCHRLYWSYSRATRLWRTTRRVWRGCSRTHNDSPRSARAHGPRSSDPCTRGRAHVHRPPDARSISVSTLTCRRNAVNRPRVRRVSTRGTQLQVSKRTI